MNIGGDIQSNNFVMVKTELLSHRPPSNTCSSPKPDAVVVYIHNSIQYPLYVAM